VLRYGDAASVVYPDGGICPSDCLTTPRGEWGSLEFGHDGYQPKVGYASIAIFDEDAALMIWSARNGDSGKANVLQTVRRG
jgi:hypothetical protein